MAHRFDPRKVAKLESEERRRRLPPEKVLAKIGLKEGMVLADVGAGSGYFTLPAAEVVGPSGKVFALDLSEEMRNHLLAKNPPPPVEVLPCEESRLPLADGVADRVLAAFVLHEARAPAEFLRELYRVARPGGRVAVLDWVPLEEEEGPPLEDRIAPEEARRLLRQAGFHPVEEEPFGGSFYLLLGLKCL
jgi:SAM-dependent methyltransferase